MDCERQDLITFEIVRGLEVTRRERKGGEGRRYVERGSLDCGFTIGQWAAGLLAQIPKISHIDKSWGGAEMPLSIPSFFLSSGQQAI